METKVGQKTQREMYRELMLRFHVDIGNKNSEGETSLMRLVKSAKENLELIMALYEILIRGREDFTKTFENIFVGTEQDPDSYEGMRERTIGLLKLLCEETNLSMEFEIPNEGEGWHSTDLRIKGLLIEAVRRKLNVKTIEGADAIPRENYDTYKFYLQGINNLPISPNTPEDKLKFLDEINRMLIRVVGLALKA